ncbi:MAG: hypothetical protein ACLRMJ_01650 [Alistipes finegoldii]
MVVDTMENEETSRRASGRCFRAGWTASWPFRAAGRPTTSKGGPLGSRHAGGPQFRANSPVRLHDNYRGGVEATRILLQRGHRRIACIQGVPIRCRTAGACRVISTRSDKRDCRRKPS